MTTTSQTITRSQIRQLRAEARSAGNGDLLMVIACDMALHGGERNEDDVRALPLSQHRRIPAGEEEAIEICAQAIADAEAQS